MFVLELVVIQRVSLMALLEVLAGKAEIWSCRGGIASIGVGVLKTPGDNTACFNLTLST